MNCPTDVPAHTSVRQVIRDANLPLSVGRILNNELLDALTNAAGSAGVDDKQYVV